VAHRGRKNADEAIIVALATGATVGEAAAKAEVSPRTVHRRLTDTEFRAAVIQRRATMISSALGRLADGMTEAADTLRALLKADAETVRLGAARALLETSIKLRDSVEMEERVTQLESLTNELDKRKRR